MCKNDVQGPDAGLIDISSQALAALLVPLCPLGNGSPKSELWTRATVKQRSLGA